MTAPLRVPARQAPIAPLPAPFPPGCRLVVFDLDGTLYHQGPVRRAMARRLVLTRAREDGLGRLERIRLLGRARRLREVLSETAPAGFEAALFARLARETGHPEAVLRALVRGWMEERPLALLRPARVAGAGRLFAALRARGVTLAVWSDHPAREKLAALGLAADHVVSAADEDVGALKPDPAGLRRILARAGCPPHAALMIGDRPERDGAAAEALGVPFIRRGRPGRREASALADFRPLLRAMGETT